MQLNLLATWEPYVEDRKYESLPPKTCIFQNWNMKSTNLRVSKKLYLPFVLVKCFSSFYLCFLLWKKGDALMDPFFCVLVYTCSWSSPTSTTRNHWHVVPPSTVHSRPTCTTHLFFRRNLCFHKLTFCRTYFLCVIIRTWVFCVMIQFSVDVIHGGLCTHGGAAN